MRNKGSLLKLLDETVMRDDKADSYSDWIDTALREIQMDVSWSCMRHTAFVTIPTLGNHVSLPADFKELQPVQPPVWVTSTGNYEYPCIVKSRGELLAFPTSLFFPITPTRIGARNALPTFLEPFEGSEVPHIWTAAPVGEDLRFRVLYYRFLPDLVAATDTNALVTDYHQMVDFKLLSVAFAAIQDPTAAGYEVAYTDQRKRRVLADKARQMSGRVFRMGG